MFKRKLSHQSEVVAMIRAVTTYYDEERPPVLVNITFDVRRGEIFGLVGPAGSGKSTIIKILAGQRAPTRGRVKVFGRSPRRRAVKARVGYMPEPPGRSPKEHRPWVLLRKIFGWKRRHPSLAVGPLPAQRRAALAQAMVKSPDLFLLDEPFVGFDPIGCRELKELMLALARVGKTVVISSRSLADLKDICSRLAVFYGGQLEAVGTIEELLAKPNAVRFLTPVLGPEGSKRLLQVISESLTLETEPPDLSNPQLENHSLNPASAVSTAGQKSPAASTLAVFAPVSKKLVPELSPGTARPAPDSIDHQRLAELTQPSAAGLSAPGEANKSPDQQI